MTQPCARIVPGYDGKGKEINPLDGAELPPVGTLLVAATPPEAVEPLRAKTIAALMAFADEYAADCLSTGVFGAGMERNTLEDALRAALSHSAPETAP